jgi:hypothetical protein
MNNEKGARLARRVALVFLVGTAAFAATFMMACGGGGSGTSNSPKTPGSASSANAGTSNTNGSTGDSADVDKIKGRFNDEGKAAAHKDWKTLYNLFSPRSRSDCAYSDFKDVMEIAYGKADSSSAAWANVRVTVHGDRALVTAYGAGGDFSLAYVKVNGTWYDDNAGDSACHQG